MFGQQIFDKRPPFVRFETREYGVNQELTAKEGRIVPNQVDFALIVPFASKDQVEKPATEWLAQIKAQAMAGNYPSEWVQMFNMHYEEWKKGNEVPREGTPVRGWALLTKEQANRLHFKGITTVEDLAEVPDQGLGEMGLDGRYMRDTAKAWINEYKDKGVNAKLIGDAQATIREQADVIERLEKRLEALEQGKRGPGRPRKVEEEAA